MKPSRPAAMLKEGMMPVVRLSLWMMMLSSAPITPPATSDRICMHARMWARPMTQRWGWGVPMQMRRLAPTRHMLGPVCGTWRARQGGGAGPKLLAGWAEHA